MFDAIVVGAGIGGLTTASIMAKDGMDVVVLKREDRVGGRALYPMCWKLEGVAKSISQAGTLKPDVKAVGPEGLYFTGDTARGLGVAMDCACSAGINCAASVLERDIGIE